MSSARGGGSAAVTGEVCTPDRPATQEVSTVEKYGFGALVNVSHVVVRLKGQSWVGPTGRDRLRYVGHDKTYRGDWPGEPVRPDGWEPGKPSYKDHRLYLLEPPLSSFGSEWIAMPVARLRRLPFQALAIVIGATTKHEGIVDSSSPDFIDEGSGSEGFLAQQRSVTLLEVALAPERRKSRVALVLPEDCEPA
jgi:hypothetical protein